MNASELDRLLVARLTRRNLFKVAGLTGAVLGLVAEFGP